MTCAGTRLAIRRSRDRLGKHPRLRVLVRRLERARKTPQGCVFLELGVGSQTRMPGGFYARLKKVTNGEYHAWFREASLRESLLPPSSWGGQNAFPRDRDLDPVKGVRREEAHKFAGARGERLPSQAERAALEAYLERNLEPERRGRFPEGFRTVLDVGTQ